MQLSMHSDSFRSGGGREGEITARHTAYEWKCFQNYPGKKVLRSTCIRLARICNPLALYYSLLTHHTKKPGWSHARVLHGPEGSAVVSLIKLSSPTQCGIRCNLIVKNARPPV